MHEPDVSPDGRRSSACWWGPRPPRAGDRADRRRRAAHRSCRRARPRLRPAFSPDGRHIAYSRWKPGGFRDIHVYDLATAPDRALWVDRAMDIDPRFSPDGRYVVFSSDRTGIYNLYAYELATERLYQVTNVLSGAFQPTVSPDGHRLVFTGFTTDGFDSLDDALRSGHRSCRPSRSPTRVSTARSIRTPRPTRPTPPPRTPQPSPSRSASSPTFPGNTCTRTSGRSPFPETCSGSGQTFEVQTARRRSSRHPRLRLQFPVSPQRQPLRRSISYANYRFWPVLGVSLSKVDAHHQRLDRRQPATSTTGSAIWG